MSFSGRELRRGFGPFRILDYTKMYRRAGQIFTELKSETRPRDLIKQMSGGQRQAVAIARTMLSDAKIVLMDEPTAAISVRQVAEVLNLIRHLSDRGIAVVLIGPPHAGCFFCRRPHYRSEARAEGGRQANHSEFTGRSHRAHHRSNRTSRIGRDYQRRGQTRSTMAITLDQAIGQKQQNWLSSLLASQTFWVFIAVILACVFLLSRRTPSRPRKTSTTSRAMSPS